MDNKDLNNTLKIDLVQLKLKVISSLRITNWLQCRI